MVQTNDVLLYTLALIVLVADFLALALYQRK